MRMLYNDTKHQCVLDLEVCSETSYEEIKLVSNCSHRQTKPDHTTISSGEGAAARRRRPNEE
jgi:hypothetical protein